MSLFHRQMKNNITKVRLNEHFLDIFIILVIVANISEIDKRDHVLGFTIDVFYFKITVTATAFELLINEYFNKILDLLFNKVKIDVTDVTFGIINIL